MMEYRRHPLLMSVWPDKSKYQLVQHLEPEERHSMYKPRLGTNIEIVFEGHCKDIEHFVDRYNWPNINFDLRRVVGYSMEKIKGESK